MSLDPTVIPGLLLLAAELIALAAVGYIVVRVALRQGDEPAALAQGLAVGPALWGITTNFVLFVLPGLAGAAVGWGIVAIAGVALARRSSRRIRPRPRTVAQFAIAALALIWIALAVRQTAGIGDAETHIGTAASIRAGMFPPELSWSPGMPLRYHFGVDMVAGLLAPPAGPDLAFVLEILGVYFWISLALIMITALKLRGGWPAVIVMAPLLITPGAWTWIGVHLGATKCHARRPRGSDGTLDCRRGVSRRSVLAAATRATAGERRAARSPDARVHVGLRSGGGRTGSGHRNARRIVAATTDDRGVDRVSGFGADGRGPGCVDAVGGY